MTAFPGHARRPRADARHRQRHRGVWEKQPRLRQQRWVYGYIHNFGATRSSATCRGCGTTWPACPGAPTKAPLQERRRVPRRADTNSVVYDQPRRRLARPPVRRARRGRLAGGLAAGALWRGRRRAAGGVVRPVIDRLPGVELERRPGGTVPSAATCCKAAACEVRRLRHQADDLPRLLEGGAGAGDAGDPRHRVPLLHSRRGVAASARRPAVGGPQNCRPA